MEAKKKRREGKEREREGRGREGRGREIERRKGGGREGEGKKGKKKEKSTSSSVIWLSHFQVSFRTECGTQLSFWPTLC